MLLWSRFWGAAALSLSTREFGLKQTVRWGPPACGAATLARHVSIPSQCTVRSIACDVLDAILAEALGCDAGNGVLALSSQCKTGPSKVTCWHGVSPIP